MMSLLIVSIGFGQSDTTQGNQFELKGVIVNDVSLTPHCGTIAWGTVIEFEIIQFTDTSYSLDSIGIIAACPEFYGDNFFEVGKEFKLVVVDENQADFGWTIHNESILSKYGLKKKLWLVSVEKDTRHE